MKFKDFLKAIANKKMLITFALGFASGLPLLLTGGTLKLWLTREGVDVVTLGFFSWVGMAYSLKFFWAPAVDGINFGRWGLATWGRRRSWTLLMQIFLLLSISLLSFCQPKQSLFWVSVLSVLVAFFSATQDMAIDAFRREYLRDEELGVGTSFHTYGYRLAMLVTGGLGVGLVSENGGLTWNSLYLLMASLMVIGIIATYFAPEPKVDQSLLPQSIRSAVIDPFKEFLTRDKAITVLAFVFLFKLGDALSGAMLSTFYAKMGYTNEEIGLIAKIFGIASSLVGIFIGGLVIYSIGIFRSLWIFGILQGLSTATFALITFTGPVKWALAVAVIFEDVSSGMGSAAFLAYLATLTNKRFTATQYALLASIATLGRNFFAGFSGIMVEKLDWAGFFYTCALIAIPGLLMLFLIENQRRTSQRTGAAIGEDIKV